MARRPAPSSLGGLGTYWALDAEALLRQLRSGPEGLSSADAAERLRQYGPNELREHDSLSALGVLLKQIRSPLLLLLVFAAAASALSGEWLDSAIVLTIVVATVGIGFSREHSAQAAVAALRARVRVRTNVLRNGRPESVPVEAVVPGDVVLLSAGSLVPADSVVLDTTDCFVSEAVLTGESFPVEKRPGATPASAVLAKRANCVSLGTNVRSGTAKCLVVKTGATTECTELVIALVVRTRRPFFRSRPGTVLLVSTAGLIVLAFAIPYLPFAGLFGFVPLPGALLVTILGITGLYVAAAEVQKKWFYRAG